LAWVIQLVVSSVGVKQVEYGGTFAVHGHGSGGSSTWCFGHSVACGGGASLRACGSAWRRGFSGGFGELISFRSAYLIQTQRANHVQAQSHNTSHCTSHEHIMQQ